MRAGDALNNIRGGMDDLADPVSSAVIGQTVVVTAMVSVTTTVMQPDS